jgi:hypothetical protein
MEQSVTYSFETDPDQGFANHKLGLIYCWIKKFFGGSKITNYPSLGLHKWFLSYRRCLRPSKQHPALQNIKFLNFFYFCGSFSPYWIRILYPDTDPLIWLNPESGSETLVWNSENTVPVFGWISWLGNPWKRQAFDFRRGSEIFLIWVVIIESSLR